MLLGFGIIFCIVSGSAMLGELSYPKERPMMTPMFNASIFRWSNCCLWNHRQNVRNRERLGLANPVTAPVLPIPHTAALSFVSFKSLTCYDTLLVVVIYSFLPESPRYLISKDRREEAYDIT
jgi:hypothetical protein